MLSPLSLGGSASVAAASRLFAHSLSTLILRPCSFPPASPPPHTSFLYHELHPRCLGESHDICSLLLPEREASPLPGKAVELSNPRVHSTVARKADKGRLRKGQRFLHDYIQYSQLEADLGLLTLFNGLSLFLVSLCFSPCRQLGGGATSPTLNLLHPDWWYLRDHFSNDWPWGLKMHRLIPRGRVWQKCPLPCWCVAG